ncbi:hypothetical protein LOD99_15422 [Oopsacas minuta]|uniref:Uncharacterized protein n=1 Tax=Oopsacas minuta TaxID=111878 RepID=A0AAV7KEX4_9METZ|nr:hypothetical protein LOD99_15422 [Oopsacas minuta]
MQLLEIQRLLLLLLLSGFVTSSSQQCNTPILRDIIDGGSGEGDFINSLGSNRVVPVLNQSEALEIRVSGFNFPIFRLNTNYDINAIDIQFGSEGTSCSDNGIAIEMETITIGNSDPVDSPGTAVQIGYDDNDIMNLIELGDPNEGRIIRLRFNAARGRYIKYGITTTNPPGNDSNVVELCLRTEFYGCTSGGITGLTFLQYNLIEPTVYTDSIYTGITSKGYMSGGEGLLNDGSIGTSPIADNTQWIGWDNPDMENPEVLFLFSRDVNIRNISIFYWGETSSDITVQISSVRGIETVVDEITQNEGSVYRRIYVFDGVTTGLIKLNFIGISTVLLTEIEIIEPLEGMNLLGPTLDTSRFIDTTTAATAGITTPQPPTPTTPTTPTTSTTGIISTSSIATTKSNSNNQTISQPVTKIPTITTTTTPVNTNSYSIYIIILVVICILISVGIIPVVIVCAFLCYKAGYKVGQRDKSDYVDMQPDPKHDYEQIKPETEPQYQNLSSSVREHTDNIQDGSYYVLK